MTGSDLLDDVLEVETMLVDIVFELQKHGPLPEYVKEALARHNEATDRLRAALVVIERARRAEQEDGEEDRSS